MDGRATSIRPLDFTSRRRALLLLRIIVACSAICALGARFSQEQLREDREMSNSALGRHTAESDVTKAWADPAAS